MSRELKRLLLKEKMMEVKAGDYLEWYDSLDAVEKGLYKEEFKKLQVVKGRIIEAATNIAVAIEEELFTMIQEEMLEKSLVVFDDAGLMVFDGEMDDRFDKVYKHTLAILVSKQLEV